MSVASFEQIIHWLAKSLWPLLKQYAIPVTAFWIAVAVIYIILKTKKLFRSKAEPDITYAHIKIEPSDLPSFRYIQGTFVVVNSGRQPCNVMSVKVLHESLDFEISDIFEDIREENPIRDKGKIGLQTPLVIRGNKTKKIFFIGSHKIETLEELQEKLSLEVTIDCTNEPFLIHLTREAGKKTYVP